MKITKHIKLLITVAILIGPFLADAADAAHYERMLLQNAKDENSSDHNYNAWIVGLNLAGGNINIQDKTTGNTALHYAIANGKAMKVSLLLEQPAINLKIKNHAGETPFKLALHKSIAQKNSDYDTIFRMTYVAANIARLAEKKQRQGDEKVDE